MNRRRVLVSLAVLATFPSAVFAAPSSKDIYQAASQANGFSIGAPMAVNVVYVFFDPRCPHCAHLWGTVKPLLGRLKVVWIPVGILSEASTPQGATILAALNPSDAMDHNEALVLDRKTGLPIDPALRPEALAKVQANNALFDRLGGDSVPMIVYKNGRTGEYGAMSGALETTQLQAMLGL